VARIRDFATGRAIPPPHESLGPQDAAPRAAPRPIGAIAPPYDGLPAAEQRLHLWAESLPSLDDAETSQKDWSAEYMARWAATPQDGVLGDLPLIVLTRAKGGFGDRVGGVPGAELEEERKRLQAGLAKLSHRSEQRVVAGGHNLHLDSPDAVADAIRRVYDLSRSH
jgi:hypothetical protein